MELWLGERRSGEAFAKCGTMADDGKVFLDANNLYLDSFKLARKIWDDGFRPTVRAPPTGAVLSALHSAPLTIGGAY